MRLQHYGLNQDGRDFAVGDLHGHFGLLQAQLDAIAFDPARDRLFSVGDLVDRGPESLRCLELVFEPWFHAVRGNHEAMMFDSLLRNRRFDLWMLNGGQWIYELNIDRVAQLCRRLDSLLPFALEIETAAGRVGLVHAEVPGDDWRRVEAGDSQTLLWSRERIGKERTAPVRGIDQLVVGHTPVRTRRRLGNVHYIDTGAYFTGNLTVVALEALFERRSDD